MTQDAKERAIWKARVAQLAEQVPAGITRPVRKLIAEGVFAILASGSVQQAAMARALREPGRVHHTQKRLSRMLGRHSEVVWAAETLQLEQVGSRVHEGMVLAIDPGDLNRDGARHSEYRGRIRDGDCGEIAGGYPLLSVVARDMASGETLPLLTRLGSAERTGHRSENHEIMSVMEEIQRHVKARPLWVIDRGGDRGRLWDAWIDGDWRVLVRAANLRYWQWRGELRTAQQIARHLPLKHRGKLRRRSEQSVRFGITQVHLRTHPERRLSMLVVRHGKREPMVLVTTDRIRGRRQGECLMQAYMDRWACEEGYRFTKQGFDLEKVMARRFATLQNLVALASLAWAFLAVHQHDKRVLMAKARRQKRQHPPAFPFYSLLAGWRALFAHAQQVFHRWWRAPEPGPAGHGSPPHTGDLFASPIYLVPAGL